MYKLFVIATLTLPYQTIAFQIKEMRNVTHTRALCFTGPRIFQPVQSELYEFKARRKKPHSGCKL